MRLKSAAAPATVIDDESLFIHSIYRGRKRRGRFISQETCLNFVFNMLSEGRTIRVDNDYLER